MQQLDLFQVFDSMIFVYSNIMSNVTLEGLLTQMQLIMLIKTVYFALSTFLPIEGLVNSIFTPFSYMHQMYHAHAAKKLNDKYRDEKTGLPKNFIRMNVSLGGSSVRNKEYSNISFMINNTSGLTIRDVMYFANSSTVPAFLMLIAVVSLGQLMQEFIFAVIHLYVICGITLCLMPSKADSKLITNFILIRTEISPWYIINMFLLFLVAAGTYGLKYYYLDYFPNYWIIEPITMGIWSVICYLFIFSLIVSLSNEKKLFPLRKKNDYQYLKELNVALENDKYKSQTEDQEYMNDLDTAF